MRIRVAGSYSSKTKNCKHVDQYKDSFGRVWCIRCKQEVKADSSNKKE